MNLNDAEAAKSNSSKTIILDANILIRAVLGKRVWQLIHKYVHTTTYLAPEVAFADARRHIPAILQERHLEKEANSYLELIDKLERVITPIQENVYREFESEAKLRLHGKDEEDWPFVALALRFEIPIWTEDRDFFGVGVTTWQTDKVEMFLK